MNTFIAQQSLIWILGCLCLILFALHLKNALKKKKEKQRQDLALAEAKKEEKRLFDLREVLPKLFTGAQLDHLRARHFIFNVMRAEERDAMVQWFQTHVEIFGEMDFEKIISEDKRPSMSFDEFQAFFMVVFNEGYFDSGKLPFGGQLEMSQKLNWAQARLRSALSQNGGEDELSRLAKQVKFNLEDLARTRKLAVAELEALQKKSVELDQVLDKSEKAEKERWEMFITVRDFLKDWPEARKALNLAKSEYDEHLKELINVKKAGITNIRTSLENLVKDMDKAKNALLRLEEWKKNVEQKLGNLVKENTNHLDKMLEQAMVDIRKERETKMGEISKHVDDTFENLSEYMEKLENQIGGFSKFSSSLPNNNVFARLVSLVFLLVAITIGVWSSSRILEKDYFSTPVVFSENQDDLLSDSDPEKFVSIEENEMPPFYAVNEEEEVSYHEEKEYLEKEATLVEEPKLVPVPIMEKKTVKKSVACQDKKCCLDRFGRNTKTWPQAIECMRSIK